MTMLLRTLLNRALQPKKRVIGILLLLVLLLCTVFVEQNKEQKEAAIVDMSCYPLPVKNLRKLIDSAVKGRQQNSSEKALTNFAHLEFSPLSAGRCSPNKDIGLLIPIKSAVGNYLNRATIRAMWANENYLKSSKIPTKYAFFVGVGQFNGSYPPKLLEEIKVNEDLVLIEYFETYRNNTFKSIAMMKWAQEYCPNHEFVITLDDDVYFSMTNLIKFLQRRPHNHPYGARNDSLTGSKFRLAFSPDEFLYAGLILGGLVNPVERSKQSKASLSWNDYPFEMFPNYATGALVIYTSKTYRDIYLAAPFVKFLNVDDVYIGIVAAKMDIKPTGLTQYITCCSNWAKNETAIGIHQHRNPKNLLQYWIQPHNDARILKQLTAN